ncbi:MAG TPA: GGDEF and EAL domain-containing protein [Longimicrobium sp.]|nr:GGDEF and EAL domain-containing protein [Longimicrobium sp.]
MAFHQPSGRGRSDTGAIPEKEILTYRLVSALAAVAVLGFGLVYRGVLPEANDPWLYRFVVAGACLVVAGLSFRTRAPSLLWAMYALFGIVTGWVVVLLGMNGFAAEYALGLVVVSSIISALFRSTRALAIYGAATLGSLAAVAASIPAPRLSPLLFGSYLVVILVLFFVVVRNRLRAEREIAASERRYALAALGAHDGLWDWDVAAGTLYLSPRWKEIVGCADHEIGSDPDEWLSRIHPDDRMRVQAELFRPGEPSGSLFESEHRIARSDGSWAWVLVRGVRVVDEPGGIVRMAGSQTDVSQRKRYEEQLVHDALHDGLTGLPNRALFLDRLERAIAQARRRPDRGYTVFFLDLDRFKVVNDRIGHAAADEVLVAMARRLEGCTRHGDSVARLGADEFALLMHDAANPSAIAHRIQHELAHAFQAGGQELLVTASLGIAPSAIGYGRPEDVLRDAEAAMHRAKARGRARFEVADAELHARSLQQLELEGQLREALVQEHFRLHFQPVVVMESRQVVGFEALLRWEHPQHGLRSPDDFIPLAEQTGMIMTIGRWALREGCRQMQAWRRAYPAMEPLWLSVNLSSRQFLHPQLVQEIHDILADTGFPADRLRLEITESVIMDEPAAVGLVLQALRSSGIRVAVDDFGTGYSSLAYLHQLPVDTLKIDRSFVHNLHADAALRAVVQTVISLSGSLALETVAEGVETEEDARALHGMGCRVAQGFLFSHPLPADDAGRLLAELGTAAVSRE